MTKQLKKLSEVKNLGPHNEPVEREEAIKIWDNENPGSVVNMVPERVSKRFAEALSKEPLAFELDEQSLAVALRKKKCMPTATDNRLRLKFWIEYDRCKALGLSKMEMNNIYAGVCSDEFFYNHYLRAYTRVAWLLCPPVAYSAKLTECLDYSLDQLREILSLSIYKTGDDGTETGEIDLNLCKLKAGIHKMLDDRANGMGTLKIEKKSLQISGKISDMDRKMIAEMSESATEEELNKRLYKVMAKEKEAMHLPIDVPIEKIVVDTNLVLNKPPEVGEEE